MGSQINFNPKDCVSQRIPFWQSTADLVKDVSKRVYETAIALFHLVWNSLYSVTLNLIGRVSSFYVKHWQHNHAKKLVKNSSLPPESQVNFEAWLSKYRSCFRRVELFPNLFIKSQFKDSEYPKKLMQNIDSFMEQMKSSFVKDFPIKHLTSIAKGQTQQWIDKSDFCRQGTCFGQSIAISKFLFTHPSASISKMNAQGERLRNEVLFFQLSQSPLSLIYKYQKILNQEYASKKALDDFNESNPSISNARHAMLSKAYEFYGKSLLQEFPKMTSLNYSHVPNGKSQNAISSLNELLKNTETICAHCFELGVAKQADIGSEHGHSLLIHINDSQGVYELYDSDGIGLLSFSDKAMLIDCVVDLCKAIYPNIHSICHLSH